MYEYTERDHERLERIEEIKARLEAINERIGDLDELGVYGAASIARLERLYIALDTERWELEKELDA